MMELEYKIVVGHNSQNSLEKDINVLVESGWKIDNWKVADGTAIEPKLVFLLYRYRLI